jgi:hypothetical protein
LRFLTTIFLKEKEELALNWYRCCHLALYLWLILFHLFGSSLSSQISFSLNARTDPKKSENGRFVKLFFSDFFSF